MPVNDQQMEMQIEQGKFSNNYLLINMELELETK